MQTEHLPIAALHAPPLNVRLHPAEQIAEFARSIEMFGQIRPVVIDDDNTVLAGNGLVEALKSLGRTEAAVFRVSGLSEAEKSKLMLSDNRLFQLGFDDNEAIMDFIRSLDGDTDIPGFDPASLDFGPITVPEMKVDAPTGPPTGRERQQQQQQADQALSCPHCGHRITR
jgi:hypothetical protein